jgi:hypothetical protein
MTGTQGVLQYLGQTALTFPYLDFFSSLIFLSQICHDTFLR